jgi:hypothetical protein
LFLIKKTSIYGDLPGEFLDRKGTVILLENIFWISTSGKAFKEERITRINNKPNAVEQNSLHRINIELPKVNLQRYVPLSEDDYGKVYYGIELLENPNIEFIKSFQ